MADQWDITTLASYKSRKTDELNVLWESDLPPTREAAPALWESLLGFFEDAIVEFCKRPGHLVVTPRELLKALKRMEREPFCGQKVINELFRRGDLVTAGTLDASDGTSAATPGGSVLNSLRSSLGRFLWSTSADSTAPAPEDEIVPAASLSRLGDAAMRLVGPIATAEVHTIKSLAIAITGGNERDAAAVAAHLVSQGKASVLRTTPTPEQPTSVVGVRLGPGRATDADRSLLQTKAARERLANVAAHLSAEIETEKTAAIAMAKAGNKPGALARVQRKALLEKKLQGTQASLRKLADVLMAVDEAENNREAVAALQTGMESLRAVTEGSGGVTAERVDDMAAQLDELLGRQDDLRIALQQVNAHSELELEAAQDELNALLAEDSRHTLSDPALNVPSTTPFDPAIAAATAAADAASTAAHTQPTEEEKHEAELARLLAESGLHASPQTEHTQEKERPARGIAAPAP